MNLCPLCGSTFPDAFKFCAHDATPLVPTPQADPHIGRRIEGRYHLEAFLGRGGYGTVYRAVDERIKRDVAVKLLSPSLTTNPAEIDRFRGEASALAALRHPHIVFLYDFGQDGGAGYFMVMEHLRGETLADRVARGPLPILDFYYITRQAVSALSAAHELQIIHRDIKTQNIFLANDPASPYGYSVRLLDFGLAQIARPGPREATYDQNRPPAKPRLAVGTPIAISPEALQGAPVDARADIYALGLVLYELLTGEEPFPTSFIDDLLTNKLAGRFLRPSDQPNAAWIPQELEGLILSMMDRSPARRPQTVDAVLLELDRMQSRVEDAWAASHLTSRRRSSPRPRAAEEAPKPAFPNAGRRVLIVDDDHFQRMLLRALVEDSGYECHTVESSEAALAWIHTNRAPDALIVDVLMPGLDGISLIRRLRLMDIRGPILVCTSLSSPEIRSEVEDLARVVFLNKAKDLFRLPELLSQLLADHPD